MREFIVLEERSTTTTARRAHHTHVHIGMQPLDCALLGPDVDLGAMLGTSRVSGAASRPRVQGTADGPRSGAGTPVRRLQAL